MKIFREIGRNTQIDWMIIIFCTTAVIASLAFGGIYLYNAVTRGDIQGVANNVNLGRNLDIKTLSLVASDFSARADVTKRVRAGYSGPRDPSI
jgi:hypothetical protein